MALRSKLKRTQAGSRAWQKSAGVKTTKQPDVTPLHAKVGKRIAKRRIASSGSKYPAQPQPAQPTPTAQPSFWTRAKEAGFSETIRRGLKVGTPPTQREPETNIGLALMALPGGAGIKAAGKKGAKALTKKAVAGKAAKHLLHKEAAQTITKMPNKEAITKAAGILGKGQNAKLAKAEAGSLLKPAERQTVLAWGKSKTNTKTARLTGKMLDKVIAGAKAHPIVAGAIGLSAVMAITGAIQNAIGTYPFAGFIKEESLQQLNWAYTRAEDNDDLVGMREALDFQKEVLDITTWEGIIAKIPWANIQAQNKDFYKAAEIQRQINEREFAKRAAGEPSKFIAETEEAIGMREESQERQQERFESFSTMDFERKQQADEEMKEYFTELNRQKQFNAEQNQQFWAEYEANKEEFWEEYQRKRQEQAPSKLGFGLL